MRSLLNAILIGLTLIAATSARADQLRYIPDGKDALMEFAELIKSAKKSIDLTYYIMDPCSPSTKTLIQLMEQQAARGVRVRIIIDAFTHDTKLRMNYTELLKSKNIQIKYFNTNPIINLNYRTHAKVMIADGREYISGGRNIAQDYFSMGPELNFIDRDVHVVGRSAIQAQRAFDYLWKSKMTVVAPLAKDLGAVQELGALCGKWDKETASLAKLIYDESKKTVANRKQISCDNVKFVMDDYHFPRVNQMRDENNPPLTNKFTTQALTQFINQTTQVLIVENWAYDPRGSIYEGFKTLREKGIPIHVMTNKVSDVGGVMDYLSSSSSSRDNVGSQYNRALSSQGSINDRWERSKKTGYWMIHSKVFVSDDRNTAVTSFNLDSRSYRYNIESAVMVKDCPEFAEVVLNNISKLNKTYEKDQSCESCQHPPSFKMQDKLISILAGHLY